MSNFKKVLEIEKKYNHIINLAKNNSEKKIVSFENELNLREEVIKNDFKSELEREFNHQVSLFEAQGESQMRDAKDEVELIFKTVDVDGAADLLLEEIKNV